MMAKFHYVYILVSVPRLSHHYTGLTRDLESRLRAHNTGKLPHTAKYRPWRVETAIAFRCRKKAATFERYLKSHSGRAFAARNFRLTEPDWSRRSLPASGRRLQPSAHGRRSRASVSSRR
jgi:predicted GIY-YIG superfamily endonuclease